MWFCFTVIGTIAALVIIMSLWEKFQTNPTITGELIIYDVCLYNLFLISGLDTDFHNQQVIFPTTVVCPEVAYDEAKAMDIAYKMLVVFCSKIFQKKIFIAVSMTKLTEIKRNLF